MRLLFPWGSSGRNTGLQCPPLGDLPDPGIEPASLTSLALAGRFFTISTAWEVHVGIYIYIYIYLKYINSFYTYNI